jgi:hypothetical protein
MHVFKGSPIVGYKIAIVNNANLENPEHYVYASKRLMRAVRKARAMIGSHKYIQLFGVKQDGTHFPVSLKVRTVNSYRNVA